MSYWSDVIALHKRIEALRERLREYRMLGEIVQADAMLVKVAKLAARLKGLREQRHE